MIGFNDSHQRNRSHSCEITSPHGSTTHMAWSWRHAVLQRFINFPVKCVRHSVHWGSDHQCSAIAPQTDSGNGDMSHVNEVIILKAPVRFCAKTNIYAHYQYKVLSYKARASNISRNIWGKYHTLSIWCDLKVMLCNYDCYQWSNEQYGENFLPYIP